MKFTNCAEFRIPEHLWKSWRFPQICDLMLWMKMFLLNGAHQPCRWWTCAHNVSMTQWVIDSLLHNLALVLKCLFPYGWLLFWIRSSVVVSRSSCLLLRVVLTQRLGWKLESRFLSCAHDSRMALSRLSTSQASYCMRNKPDLSGRRTHRYHRFLGPLAQEGKEPEGSWTL